MASASPERTAKYVAGSIGSDFGFLAVLLTQRPLLRHAVSPFGNCMPVDFLVAFRR